ncbi:unnamed protein product [Penicillium salamii]|nr:unnamed protein product [Penicillium salamii]
MSSPSLGFIPYTYTEHGGQSSTSIYSSILHISQCFSALLFPAIARHWMCSWCAISPSGHNRLRYARCRGNPVTKKVPIIFGNPDESFVLIEQEFGRALGATSPVTLASEATVEDRCKLSFFHDSQHFGFESLSYLRLYIPSPLPRQTKSDTSLATLFLSRKMHEITLDGTFDGII